MSFSSQSQKCKAGLQILIDPHSLQCCSMTCVLDDNYLTYCRKKGAAAELVSLSKSCIYPGRMKPHLLDDAFKAPLLTV